MRKVLLVCALTVSSTLLACGGSQPASKSADNASSGASTTGTDTSAGSASSAADADGGPPSTTTATLGAGGDLQGAKLEQKSQTTVETKATSTGPTPKGDGHSQEPGRRVDDIKTIIQSHRDEARKCYDDALKAHPGIEGDLDIKWTIDPKGKVTDIGVDDTKSQIHEPSVGKCVIGIIQNLKFAESAKGFETRTHYPFNFHPKGTQNNATAPKQP